MAFGLQKDVFLAQLAQAWQSINCTSVTGLSLMKAPKQRHAVSIAISIGLVIFGLVMSFVQDIVRLPVTIMAACTRVTAPARPDFSKYDALLKSIVKDGKVDYRKAKSEPLLGAALDALASTSCEHFASNDDIICYWINAHNLLCIKLIADHYPLETLFSIKRKFIADRFVVGGKSMSIEEILIDKIHPRILGGDRKIASPSVAIFLICRGAIGYPRIIDHAITASTMMADMSNNMDLFLHDPQNVEYKPNLSILDISQFFQWYRDVFGQGFTDPWEFVLYHYDKDDKDTPDAQLEKRFIGKFNWSVNDLK